MMHSKAVLPGLALLLSGTLFAPPARADFLFLIDENVVEVKVLGQVMKPGRGNKSEPFLECEDERGEKRYFNIKDVVQRDQRKTSWEARIENQKWYEGAAPKIAKTWKAQVEFARVCRGDTRKLLNESLAHFKEAYELRAAEPLAANETQEQRNRTLARWLETDCGLLEEATNEYLKVYDQIKGAAKTVQEHTALAKFCTEHDLAAQAGQEYEAALALEPENKNIKRIYEQFKRSQVVPLNHSLYNLTEKRLAAACKYLRSQQAADGSMGADAEQAGVHTIRGMTSIAAEALLAEWDIKYYLNPEAAGQPDKEIVKALDYILANKSSGKKLLGDDLWGPTLSLQFLLRAYSRPYLEDRRSAIEEGINVSIAELKKLQRSDGGWNYYNFVQDSASFLTAAIAVNLVAARNLGFTVASADIERAREFLAATKFGKGTYRYSPDTGREGGKNTSFSPVGASARSPLCELASIATGAGEQASLQQAVNNFFLFQPILSKLRGKNATHIGKGRTAPYYFMFGHYWTSRCFKQFPRGVCTNLQNYMYGAIAAAQDPDGTYYDYTGTEGYKVYATALGVLTMHELICAEPDPAFKKAGANEAPPPPSGVLKPGTPAPASPEKSPFEKK